MATRPRQEPQFNSESRTDCLSCNECLSETAQDPFHVANEGNCAALHQDNGQRCRLCVEALLSCSSNSNACQCAASLLHPAAAATSPPIAPHVSSRQENSEQCRALRTRVAGRRQSDARSDA